MSASGKILFWAPRIICIVTILFISMFALDAFDPDLKTWHQIRNFIMHMIPSFTLTAILILAWRKEITGGTILIIVGLVLSVFVYRHNFQMNQSVIKSLIPVALLTFPFCLTGGLFIADYFYRKRHKHLLH